MHSGIIMVEIKFYNFYRIVKEYRAFYIFFTCCLLFQSCMEKTEIGFPSLEEDTKLVVYGAITPGKDVNVFVARTFPSNMNNIDNLADVYLFNAEVWLYNSSRNDSIRLELSNDSVSNYSCSKEDFEITKGETYQLFVNVDGYPTVSAGTTVPEVAAVWEDDWELNMVSVLFDGDYYDDFVFNGSWEIPSGDKYQFVTTHYYFPLRDGYGREDYGFNYNEKDSYAIYESKVITNFINSDFLVCVSLVTADRNFYTYAENYTFYNDVTEEVHNNNDGMYVDLFRGIMPEYTNIEGGYGIFGSYLEDPLVVYETDN